MHRKHQFQQQQCMHLLKLYYQYHTLFNVTLHKLLVTYYVINLIYLKKLFVHQKNNNIVKEVNYFNILDIQKRDNQKKINLIKQSQNKSQMPQQQQSKCSSFLSKLDIFSYIPVPHTYPISSSKSKIGSIVFIAIILGYLIYDFVKFITSNTPVINLYYENTPDNKQYEMPNIAFGYVYGPNLNYTLNDPSIMTYSFDTINSTYSNGALNSVKINQPLITNCQPSWLGLYNNVYQNFSCVNGKPTIMNPPLKRPVSIQQRLTITLCTPGNKNNITCQSPTQIAQMMAGGRFVIITNQPQGFNFQTGQIQQSDYPFQLYQFFLVPGLYNRILLEYYPYVYITYPTFLTTFTNHEYFFFKTTQPAALISNVSIYNTYLICSISFSISSQLAQVQVHYETLIQHVSLWGALASLIFTIFGICCLAYNKNKFLKKNPSWSQFDKAMKKKLQLQVQNTIKSDPYEDSSGISSIRKQVQLTHDL